MLGTVIFFHESFTNIVTITFSSLIIIELLNVSSEINKNNMKIIGSQILTFLMYLLSIILLRSYFDVSYITVSFIIKVILITIISWLPLQLAQWVLKSFYPTEQ